MKQLRSIQALRAIAALAVMCAHLHGIEARHSGESPLLSAAWIAGVSGVDLFFVISGFVMVWVAGDTTPGWRQSASFLFARATRIYPLWWLFALAMAGYFILSYGVPWDAEKLAPVNVSGIEHLWKSFLLVPHAAFPILPLGWTLMHEMYFYLAFALVLLLPQRFRLPACVIWGLVIVASLSTGMTGFYADSIVSLLLFPMTLEFLMGAGVAWLIKSGETRFAWIALPSSLFGLVWAYLTVNFLDTAALLPTLRTFTYGPAFALLLYALVSLELSGKLDRLIPQALVHIGDWSYSLYLCHILVISAFARVFFPAFSAAGFVDNAAFLILSSGAALAVSWVSYTWFERPILGATRRVRRSWSANSPPTPIKHA
ncbi:MAG: acyltransferase [Pseudomonadota bacterium]